jgi:hypothetical protein
MQDGAWTGDAGEAVEELQAYLSDQVAPLLVVDSVELLLSESATLGAGAIRSWIGAQSRSPTQQQLSLGDYLFHAIKKIQLLGRLKLVNGDRLTAYVGSLVEILISEAREEERGALRAMLQQASEGEASFAATAQRLHRPVGSAVEGGPATPSQVVNAELAANMRQFSQLLGRLGAASAAGGGTDAAGSMAAIAPQLLAAAVQSARSQPELEQHFASLSRAGLMTQVRLSDVFTTLSSSVPNWFVADPQAAVAAQSAPLAAMHRIVSLAGDAERTRAHFRELLKTAARDFNEGSLARALQVLEVARRLLAEGKVDKTGADLILSTAADDLDHAQLMAQATQPAAVPLLRRLMDSYPALTASGLLLALDDEPDRSRRRLWLALLEAHGVPARQTALDRLERSFADAENGTLVAWQQRNFVYLLHRIRPPVGDDPTREIRLCARCAELGGLAPLVREALINLGLRQHPDAEAVLRQRLRQIEGFLATPAGAPQDPVELRRFLGLVVSGLVRQGSREARRAVADHGLEQKAHLGDTLERLGELGTQDLADDPELVARLLAALRTQLPMRVLGLSIRRHDGAHHFVRALHGTRSESVRQVFTDLAQRFPAEPFGQDAAAALAGWTLPPPAATEPTAVASAAAQPAAQPGPAVSLAGDLEAFGLPELLQTLLQTEASGRLVLRDRAGGVIGEILLRQGMMRDVRVRDLPNPDGFYQLVEAPQPGTFEFTRQPVEAVPAGPCRELMSLMMEGMRRYDELQRSRAFAPDHGYLRATGSRPTPPEDSDGAFVRMLWTRVKDGATPRQCEETVPADSYRIRALLVHWLDDGALVLREEAENAPP